MSKSLLTTKTKESFWAMVGELIGCSHVCVFIDYSVAENAYAIYLKETAEGNDEPEDVFVSAVDNCTDSFWDYFGKYVITQQRARPENTKVKQSIEITLQAQRVIAKYCYENKCDHSAAILSAFSGEESLPPVLSLGDAKIADEVFRMLYDKIGKRMESIELTLHLMDKEVPF